MTVSLYHSFRKERCAKEKGWTKKLYKTSTVKAMAHLFKTNFEILFFPSSDSAELENELERRQFEAEIAQLTSKLEDEKKIREMLILRLEDERKARYKFSSSYSHVKKIKGVLSRFEKTCQKSAFTGSEPILDSYVHVHFLFFNICQCYC